MLLLLVPFVLASCKDDTKPGEVTSSQTSTPSDKVPSGIPSSFNYGGETFTICCASEGWNDGDDFWRQENSSAAGDPIYDAIISRNLTLSETYGIDMGKPYGLESSQDGAYAMIKNSLDSNDGAFQAISTRAADCVNLALTGYLADVNEISSIDPTN